MSKQLFDIAIVETLCKSIAIEAENAYDACRIARRRWLDESYILDAEDFATVDFMVQNPHTGDTMLEVRGGECFEDLYIETAQTEALDVKWSLDPTGVLIPEIIFQPVVLHGETVEMCNSEKAEYIQRKRIGKGAIVEIAKQGHFAPFLKRVVAISGTCEMPVFCPNCHSELKWYGVNLRCVNPYCRESGESEGSVDVEESKREVSEKV